MKIKLLIFVLLISFCSSNATDDGIFINSSDLNNLKTLDTGENIDISDNIRYIFSIFMLDIYSRYLLTSSRMRRFSCLSRFRKIWPYIRKKTIIQLMIIPQI